MTNKNNQIQRQPAFSNKVTFVAKEWGGIPVWLILLVGLVLVFGTSTLFGLFNGTTVAIAVVIYVVYVNSKQRDISASQVVSRGVSILLGTVITLTMITYLVPKIVERIENWQHWGGVLDRSGISNLQPGSGYLTSLVGESGLALDVEPLEFTVEPVSEVINTEPVMVNQVPITGTIKNEGRREVISIPQPTPTPNPVTNLTILLSRALEVKDSNLVRRYANEIAQYDPLDQNSYNALQLLERVSIQDERLNNLPKTVKSESDGYKFQVLEALTPGRYVVVVSNAETWKRSCDETAVIKVTGGWLDGNQYQVARCLLAQFDALDTGSVFEVK